MAFSDFKNLMKIEIETYDKDLPLRLTDNEQFAIDSEISIPGNAKLRYLGKTLRDGIIPGMPDIFQFSLAFGSGVITSVIGNWLYEKIKNRASVLRIERTVIEIIKKDGRKNLIKTFEKEVKRINLSK